MNREQCRAKAVELMQESGFVDTATRVEWIATALFEVAQKATREEHDRIERIIAEASFHKVREMVRTAKHKWPENSQ